MTGDWLAVVVGWARDIIGTLVILGGLALAVRVLWLSWVTGNRQIADRFTPRPGAVPPDQGSDDQTPQSNPERLSGGFR